MQDARGLNERQVKTQIGKEKLNSEKDGKERDPPRFKAYAARKLIFTTRTARFM